MTTVEFYLSAQGNDQWSGRLAEPDKDGTDGPFATLSAARDAIRKLKQSGKLSGPVRVWLRGGEYPIAEPVVFGPEDSWPVTYASYPGERAILDGGKHINGWRVEKRGDATVWVGDLPEVAAGEWYFRQLFVNGRRCPRPRLPEEGYFRMEDVPGTDLSSGFRPGADSFRCAPGDIEPWERLTDIDVVALHFWVDERMPIASFEPATRLAKCSRHSIFILVDDSKQRYARYYLDNVKEALDRPGEWYLDRLTGELSYMPMPGEDPETAQVYAPRAAQLLKLSGRPDDGEYVDHLRFVRLGFRHAAWRQIGWGDERWGIYGSDLASAPQAAYHLPGAISFEGARYCALEGCEVEHVGWYGVELTGGCRGNRIVGNTIADLGAGGVKLEGCGVANVMPPLQRLTGNNTISDNRISSGGRVFPSAVGVLCLDAFGNDILHNHIHDFYYTGISCGWYWGYGDNVAKDNLIEKNHVHEIGQGVLNDMGGIYILGVQPGTVVRGNLVHDVKTPYSCGWGVYLDQGGSHILVEGNVVYNASNQAFDIHYGRENIVRNNIFAFGAEGQARISVQEEHTSVTFERNICISDDQPMIVGNVGVRFGSRVIISDLNLFWDIGSVPVRYGNLPCSALDPEYTFEEWQEQGSDRNSIVADPKCRDLSSFDFTLADDSPALALGFQPIDMSDVGPRSGAQYCGNESEDS